MSSKIKLLIRNRNFMVCVAILTVIVMLGVVGPFFTKDPQDMSGKRFEPPSQEHTLGTDILGRDVLAQLAFGIRHSLLVGLIAGGIGLTISLIFGGFFGYLGGIVDEISNTLANIFLILPQIPLLILLSISFRQRSFLIVAFIIAGIGWAGQARSIRAQILTLKEREFVNLARMSGKSDMRIVFTEIFPNMLSYVFTSFCWMLGGAVTTEAGISLLGLGSRDLITLGTMLYYAIAAEAIARGAWWWFIPPGLVVLVFTGTLLLISSVIDEIFNPKLAKK